MAMQDMNDQVQARLAKLDKFKEMGVEAYPHKFKAKKSLSLAAWFALTARAKCASCTSRTVMVACRWWLPVTKSAKKTMKS